MRWPGLALVVCAASTAVSGAIVAGVAATPAGEDSAVLNLDDGGGYRMPVQGTVIDHFRPPEHRYGPGNRGWEIDTRTGDPVAAPGAGTVAFAGPVAGRLVISIDHADGLRSTLTGLGAIQVAAGEEVGAGEVVGRAAEVLHLGFRRGSRYVDPALLIGGTHAVLVPVPLPP